MSELAQTDSTAQPVRVAAAEAVAGVFDPDEAARSIHRWVRSHVRFVQDADLAGFSSEPDQAEVLIRPIDLLAMPQPSGDCDDFSMLAASMLMAAGIRSAFVTVAAAPDSADYSHVYVLAYPRGRAVPLDASHGPYLGWSAPAAGKSRVWPIKETTTMQNLGRLGFDWTGFENVLSTGIKSATSILAPRYAVPQLNAGQYIQNGNSVMYQQPAGTSAALSLPVAGTGGNTMLYLLGGLAVVLVLVARK